MQINYTINKQDNVLQISRMGGCGNVRKFKPSCLKFDLVATSARPNKGARAFLVFAPFILTDGIVPDGDQVLKAKRCPVLGCLTALGLDDTTRIRSRTADKSVSKIGECWPGSTSLFPINQWGIKGVLEPATNSGRSIDFKYLYYVTFVFINFE